MGKDEEKRKARKWRKFPRHGAIKGKCARFWTLLCGSGMRARILCEWGGGSADGSALSPTDSRELRSDFR